MNQYEYVRFGIADEDEYFIDPIPNLTYGNLVTSAWFHEDKPDTPVIIVKKV